MITLERLAERADLECELWTFVKRPAGPHNAAQREELLQQWREAKRAARLEESCKHLLHDLALLLSES